VWVRLPVSGERSLIIVERIITSQLHRNGGLWDWDRNRNFTNWGTDYYVKIILLQELLRLKNGLLQQELLKFRIALRQNCTVTGSYGILEQTIHHKSQLLQCCQCWALVIVWSKAMYSYP
jgi:hypothetical protein